MQMPQAACFAREVQIFWPLIRQPPRPPLPCRLASPRAPAPAPGRDLPTPARHLAGVCLERGLNRGGGAASAPPRGGPEGGSQGRPPPVVKVSVMLPGVADAAE